MIVEIVGGADQRPEVRIVDVDELSRVVLALGEVTDVEADEALQAAGLGRLAGADTAVIEVEPLRAAAGASRAAGDWSRRWEALVGREVSEGSSSFTVQVVSAAGG